MAQLVCHGQQDCFVLLMLGLKYKTKKKTYLVKRVDALKLEFISKMISIRCESALAAWCCFFQLNALLHTLYTAVTTSNIIASST